MAHAGHGYTDTNLEHLDDGSHVVEHLHEDGKSHVKHSASHLDHVHDSLEKHLRPEKVEEKEEKKHDKDREKAAAAINDEKE